MGQAALASPLALKVSSPPGRPSDTGARVLLIAPHAGGIIVHRRVSSEVTRKLGARRSWAECARQLRMIVGWGGVREGTAWP